jgi:phosphotransferase system enzyme I (PtsP)
MARITPRTGSRRLLARLRDVMAGEDGSQNKLNKIVSIIASDFVAEVCSIYVLRAGEILELFAATGLASTAIHTTRLNIGEGLIGRIAARARPLALAEAQSHSDFVYRPETGEEIFQSLAGVPVLRDGRVTGVLAVQNQTRRSYTEEEVEILETTAMVIAELITSSNLLSLNALQKVESPPLLSITMDGARFNGGLSMGTAVRHERHIKIIKLVSDDPVAEQGRLNQAVAKMHGAIDEMLEAKDIAEGGEQKEIIETYKVFAEDAGWLAKISEAIENGLTAEAAVEKVRNDTRARFRQQTDSYLRERLHDFDDLAHRLFKHLTGISEVYNTPNLPESIILIAQNMGPAELLDYDRERLKGLILEEGSATTHVSIVARALDIPVVGRVSDVLDKIESGDTIIIDGDNAQIHIRPKTNTLQAFTDMLNLQAKRIKIYASLRNAPSETKDGVRISLQINAGLLADTQSIEDTGAEGIGLYRTEILFMNSHDFPDVDRQTDLYERVIIQSKGNPVVFRTLDLGGDKGLPYWETENERNPAMGWRAMRVLLDRPTVMRHQLRALIRAAQGRDLTIMFPMITEIAEFDGAKKMLGLELKRAEEMGYKPIKVLRVGTMLEVPALAYQMPALLTRADFISIGSNDLFQFFFASDRNSTINANRYDPLSPAGINFLKNIIKQCNAAETPVSICGEMAGCPLDAMALIGIGLRTLSMTSASIGPVKAMIRSLSVMELERYFTSQQTVFEGNLREKLNKFAAKHDVVL